MYGAYLVRIRHGSHLEQRQSLIRSAAVRAPPPERHIIKRPCPRGPLAEVQTLFIQPGFTNAAGGKNNKGTRKTPTPVHFSHIIIMTQPLCHGSRVVSAYRYDNRRTGHWNGRK